MKYTNRVVFLILSVILAGLFTGCASMIARNMIRSSLADAEIPNFLPIHANPKQGDYADYSISATLGGDKIHHYEVISTSGGEANVNMIIPLMDSVILDYNLVVDSKGTIHSATGNLAGDEPVTIQNITEAEVKVFRLAKPVMMTTQAGAFMVDQIVSQVVLTENGDSQTIMFFSKDAKFQVVKAYTKLRKSLAQYLATRLATVNPEAFNSFVKKMEDRSNVVRELIRMN